MPLRPEQEYSEYTDRYINWNGLIEEIKACINAVGGGNVTNSTQYEDSWRGLQLGLSQLRSQLLNFSSQVNTSIGAAQALVSQKGQPNGIALLGPDGRLLSTQSPVLYPDNTVAKNAVVPTPTNLTLLNSWIAFGSGYSVPQYVKDGQYVTLKGTIYKNTAPGLSDLITSVPITCVPLENSIFNCSAYSGGAYGASSFYIEAATGQIKYSGFASYTGGAGSYFNLEATYISPSWALFFGDSITAGVGASITANRWTSKLATALGLREDNQGISGTVMQNSAPVQTNNGVDTYTTRILPRYPAKVYMLYGLNDMLFNSVSFSLDNFVDDYKTVIQGILNSGIAGARDIYIGSPPYINPNDYTTTPPVNGGSITKHLQYRDATRSIAGIYGCNWVDVYQGMKDGGGNSLLADPYHPNDAGHQLIANLFASLK